jgi:hypothetical protein
MGYRYFKRGWNELRGDDYGNWGTSTWYFEIGSDNYVTRQIEVYESGKVLKYDESYMEDEYGGLAEKAFESEDLEEFEGYIISREEFELAWRRDSN